MTKRISDTIITVVFVAAVFGLGIYAATATKPEFSDIENRALETLPPLFTASGINLSFTAQLDRFYTDTFPFRGDYLSLNRKLNTLYTLSPFKSDEELVIISVQSGDTQEQPTAGAQSTAPERTPGSAETPATAKAEQGSADNTESAPAGNAGTMQETPPETAPESTADTTPEPEPVISGIAIVNRHAFEMFKFDENRTVKYAETIDALAEECGVPTYVILFPSSSELYLPEKYRIAENEQTQAVKTVKQTLKTAVAVDAFDAFQNRKDRYLFFRTDHHWTADGAYLAYSTFRSVSGRDTVPLSELKSGKRSGFLGSLYKNISQNGLSEQFEKNPDFVQYYYPKYNTTVTNYRNAAMTDGEQRQVIEPDYDLNSNLYALFFGGDTTLMHMHSDIGNGKSIMVIRDSYGHAFLTFLANDYEDVYAIEPRLWSAFKLADFISEHEIDELLFVNSPLPGFSEYYLNWSKELGKLFG